MPLDPIMLQQLRDNDAPLKKLEFRHQDLSDEDFKELFQALRTNTKVKELSITGNGFSHLSLEALEEMLRFNTSLTTLILSHNFASFDASVDDASPMQTTWCIAGFLAPSLAGNTSLTELALDGNQIGNAGLGSLIEAIPSTITRLDLSDNQISDVTALSTFLKTNESLKVVELWDNDLSDEGALKLWESMAYNSTLEVLSVGRNQISAGLEEKLQQLVQSNRSVVAPKTTPKSTPLQGRVTRLEQAHAEQAKVIGDLQQKLQDQSELFQQLGDVFSKPLKKKRKRKNLGTD